MLQKILDIVKSKVFIFNAVIIVICVLAAVSIPQIIGNAGTAAGGGQDTANHTDDKTDETAETDKTTVVFGTPETVAGKILLLKATQIETAGGYKFWEIALLDNAGSIIKSWADIFAEYETAPNTIQITYKVNELTENLQVTRGGITANGAKGKYTAIVTYFGLTVEISKSETAYPKT
jgi:hypothetical protein